MSDVEAAPVFGFEEDFVRPGPVDENGQPLVGPDGAPVRYATPESVWGSMVACRVSRLAMATAQWGPHTGPLIELLTDCPMPGLLKMTEETFGRTCIGAVALAQGT